MATVDYARDGTTAVITFSNPPVNSFSHAVRGALLAALDRAAADPGVRAIVLTGAGGAFSFRCLPNHGPMTGVHGGGGFSEADRARRGGRPQSGAEPFTLASRRLARAEQDYS